MRRLAMVSLSALLLLGACGDDDKTPDAASGGTTSSTEAPGVDGSGTATTVSTPAGTDATTPTSAGGSPNTTQTTTAGGTTPSTMKQPPRDFPVKVTFAHPCVEPGGLQTIKVDTEDDAGVAYVVEFAGGQANQDAAYGGVTNHSGHFEHTFKIQPDVPRGEARAHVNVHHGERKSYATHTFMVGC